MAELLLLNGPNLNLLGTREPRHYGSTTLTEITTRLQEKTAAAGHHLSHLQSNAEHELVERIHAAGREGVVFIIINPAAFTHTSVALRDALAGVQIPFVEIHLSNIHARESFRRRSFLSDLAVGVISGFGALGYELALQAALHHITENRT